MTRELRVLVGVPGSGKSTWIKGETKKLEAAGNTTAVISRDAIRFKFLDANQSNDYFAYEREVFNEFVSGIKEAIEAGIEYIFADATHISFRSRMKLLGALKVDKDIKIVFETFEMPLEVVLFRNSLREGRERVPITVIKNMMKSFTVPNSEDDEFNTYHNTLKMKNKFEIRMHTYRGGE